MDYAAPSEREYRKYRAIAREVGVPEPFVEDAAQDIAVKLWRYPPKTNIYRKRVIRSQALDSLRRYARGGGGVLEDASVAHTFTSDIHAAWLDALALLARLAPAQRQAVVADSCGYPSHHSARYNGRHRLRELRRLPPR